jgi:hypothetical protein
MHLRSRLTVIGVALIAAPMACTGGRPAAPPSPASASAAGKRSPADSAHVVARASALRYATGKEAYQIASTGTVVVVGDTTARPDTISSAAVVRFESRWTAGGLDVTGSVTSGSGAPSVPFSATVDTATARVRIVGDSAVICPAPNGAALASVREFLSAVPRSLSPGAAWSDTVTSVACRGGILVTTTARRQFTVTSDGALIFVQHTTAAELHGATSQHGLSIELTGHGEGHATQQYQAQTGRLLGGVSTVDVALQVGATGHLVSLTQRAETRITTVDR